MSDGVTVEGLDDLRRLGEAYKAGDKALQKNIRTRLQGSAKELEEQVIREGSEKMPERGGFRARIAAARGGVTVALSGRNVSVSIRAKTREGYSLRLFDRGILRHPVFGEKRTKMNADGTLSTSWVTQKLPEHAFTDVFERGAPKVRDNLRKGVQSALDEIAREAT